METRTRTGGASTDLANRPANQRPVGVPLDAAASASDIELLVAGALRFPLTWERAFFKAWNAIVAALMLVWVVSSVAESKAFNRSAMFPAEWTGFAASICLMLTLTGWLYRAWQSRTPLFLSYMYKGKLGIEDDSRADLDCYMLLTRRYIERLRSRRRYWVAMAFEALALLFIYEFRDSIIVAVPGYNGSRILVQLMDFGTVTWLVLVPLFYAYAFSIGFWQVLSTSLHVRRCINRFGLRVIANHPDRCGGLSEIGQFALYSVSPLVWIVVELGIAGFALPKTTYGHDFSLLSSYARASFLFVGLPATIAVFFFVLWPAHVSMSVTKANYDDRFARLQSVVTGQVMSRLGQATKPGCADLSAIESLGPLVKASHDMHPDRVVFPVWPFDYVTIAKLLVPIVPPIVSSAVKLLHP